MCRPEQGQKSCVLVSKMLIPVQQPITYVVGEWNTFNKAVKVMETFYG